MSNPPSQTKDMVNERRGGKHQLVCRLEGLCGIMETEKEGDLKRRFLEKMRMYKSEKRGEDSIQKWIKQGITF